MSREDADAERRDPDRPWGDRLRRTQGADGRVTFTDEAGREWASLRDALWFGRLGMPRAMAFGEGAEALLAVMDAVDDPRGFALPFPGAHAVVAMLASAGLVVERPGNPPVLNAEGRAVRASLRDQRNGCV